MNKDCHQSCSIFQAAAASAKVASENKFQLYASSNSTGKLKIDSSEYEFKAEDLLDLGEIGRGAFGTVNKMLFQKANKGKKNPEDFLLF